MLNRSIQPEGPASAYQTFAIKLPSGPQFTRPATCEEVDCDAWRNGWVTRVPVASEMEYTVRLNRHRHPWLSETEDNGERVFTFAPGTPCFEVSQHTKLVRPDLPQVFLVRDGDFRGNPRGTPPRIHQRPEDWVEHFAETTDAVNRRIERG